MVKIVFAGQAEHSFSAGDYSVLSGMPEKIFLSANSQAVLYEKENFQGNSVVLSAHDGEKNICVADTCCKNPRSLRVLAEVKIVPGIERDRLAEEEALQNSSWLQKAWTQNHERLEWLMDSKFGCFVHWGIYAIAGGMWNGRTVGYAEHLQRAMRINLAEYKEHFIDKFNPVNFNADEWIQLVKDAGMKFFVITAKHHDGFAINHSDAYPYDIRMTPFKRDPIAELRDACLKHGIKFGMYYSHAFDWEHPDAPGNDWEYTNGGGDKHLFEGEKGAWYNQHPELLPRTQKYYVDQKSIPQILELIKKYKPALLWFDTPHKLPLSENLRIMQAIREADPSVIINGRLARSPLFASYGDYVNTGDRAWEIFPTPGPWETIPTTNESYGYSKVDKKHKPPGHFIQLLIKSANRGGNVLMNLGPTELGTIDPVDINILKQIGDWMRINGESIYGTTRSPLGIQNFGETTLKGNKLYLHFYKPQKDSVILSGVISAVDKAYVLGSDSLLPCKRLNYFDTEITIPGELPAFTVIVAEYKGGLYYDKDRMVNSKAFLHPYDASYISPELSRLDGKPGRDYIYNFTNPNHMLAWRLRFPKKTYCKLEVHYQSATGEGSYSIYADSITHTKKAAASDTAITDEMFVTMSGTKDIVFRTESAADLKMFGITVTPTEEKSLETKIEEDDTDLGD